MEKAKIAKLLKVFEDGRQEEIVNHGCALEAKGDDIKMDFIGAEALDVVKIAVGLVEACIQMGLGEALVSVFNQYYGVIQEEGAGCEKLQADNGNP